MTIDVLARRIDARFNLPRRADSQHHTSYRALVELVTIIFQSFILGLSTFVSLICIGVIGYLLGIGSQLWFIFVVVIMLVAGLGAFETWDLFLPYYRYFQRETFGVARWAKRGDMMDLQLLQPKTDSSFAPGDGLWYLLWKLLRSKKHGEPEEDNIAIGGFDFFYDFALSLKRFALHVVVIGPQGSGKSASFFMKVIRSWAEVGATIVLDPKRELFKYTARYFPHSFLLDLIDPTYSDRLAFVAGCKNNATFAFEVASMMVGFDPNTAAATKRDPFWPMAATALLKALLLYITQISDRPHPAMILEYLSSRKITKNKNGDETLDSLDFDLSHCEDEEVRIGWGIFRQADIKTQGNIVISLTVMLEPFRDPHAMLLFSPPTDDERSKGVREVPMSVLREKGNAIYVAVTSSQGARLKIVISTIFGLAASYLRSTGGQGKPYCLLAMDEGGNIAPYGLAQDMNMGRGLDMCYMLGYQVKSQPASQMGADGADLIYDGAGTIIGLPGCKGKAAEMLVRLLGKTTVLQHAATDAVDDRIDNERLTEVGRELMTEDQIRMMLKHTQAVAICDTAPPIRFAFPPDQTAVDSRIVEPKRKEITVPTGLGLMGMPIRVLPAESIAKGKSKPRRTRKKVSVEVSPSVEASSPELL